MKTNHERHAESLLVNVHSWMCRERAPKNEEWQSFKKKWFAKYNIWYRRSRALEAISIAILEIERAGGAPEALLDERHKLLEAEYEAGL